MTSLQKHTTEISKLCDSHKVKSLYAFGSILTDKFNEHSDVDFIVEFNSVDINQYADNYYDLKFSLQDILKRKVDLLEQKAIKNPFFLEALKNQRQLVYGH